ncbi:MAG: cellulase family glycosylhydrolase [Acholeplasmataceae bacterium]|nr:cellulase family glycosylhydrolase [Acholeplasmataceae bacterium]
MKTIKRLFITVNFIILLIFLVLFFNLQKVKAIVTMNTPFVTTKDGHFYVGNDKLRFVGTNNYYLHYKDTTMIDAVLDDAKEANFNVIRMWGFLDGKDSSVVENKAWMQPEQGVFTKPSWAGHDFVSGWDQMDYAISEAAKKDIRIILVLSNYWDDFGGINEYVTWYNQKHNYKLLNPKYARKKDFYTNEEIKSYYKEYVSYLLSRTNQFNGRKYIEDPTIFAWELMNEPRNPALGGGHIDDVTNWADEMSTFIKSIDPNHLVSLGDEGAFNNRESWDYEGLAQHIYDGSEGVDFEAVLALDNIDFGTYHLYPEGWGIDHSHLEWGAKFILDHINVGKELGKPVILEEFGINANLNKNRELFYTNWLEVVYDNDGAGAMFWMYASRDTSDNAIDGGYYPDYDGYRLAEIPGKYKELQVLKDYARLFLGEIVDFRDKIYVTSPYTTTGFIEIESESYEDQFFPISLKVRTAKKIKKVEMYIDNEYYETLTYNKEFDTYETMFNMRHIYRGSNVYFDFKVHTSQGEIDAETIEVRRLLKFDYFVSETFDFDEDPGVNGLDLIYYGVYNSLFNGSSWTDLNGGMIALNVNHNKDHFWSEIKLEVENLQKSLLLGSYVLSYDIYYDKNKLIVGILKPTD